MHMDPQNFKKDHEEQQQYSYCTSMRKYGKHWECFVVSLNNKQINKQQCNKIKLCHIQWVIVEKAIVNDISFIFIL